MDDPVLCAGFAVIGMSGRFPGASTTGEFWRNVCDGVESITRFAANELDDAFEPEIRSRSNFVMARATLGNVDLFDASFFGITSRDAEFIDPQHRLFLECSSEALEDAGYDPTRYTGKIGIYGGCSINTYVFGHVLQNRDAVERFISDYQVGSYPELLGAGQDFLTTRVAYKLNLRGPAMTIASACSTSLVAVAQACATLAAGKADMMLAGAVSITFPQKRGYVYQPGGMVSADGHCRPFDATASGTVFGDGAGVIVLKRLADALADGDSIYAVIRGAGVNNDGSAKAGYTAPSVTGEAAAISAAHEMAGFDPRTIRYVECHGTATPLGDPIEFAALAKIFPVTETGPYCALGSVKSNIGHLDVAAGMSGLIKTVLAVHHGKIPASLHFVTPNPRIPLAGSPFFVNTELTDWPADNPQRRAGVSAFGVGGTNAHVVLEAPPPQAVVARGTDTQLVVLSARTQTALSAMATRLRDHLQTTPERDLSDVASTLQIGRRLFEHRLALTAASVGDAIAALDTRVSISARARRAAPAVAFMFPGQGAQYVNMGRGLYERLPLFRETLDRCATILEPFVGRDIRTLLYPGSTPDYADATLDSTEFAQPAIFVVEYALAQLWLNWGVTPTAMIGHSIGEFVAATIAGVFALEDALELVAHRGKLMQALAPGAMLAVRLNEADLRVLLRPEVSIAAANSPKLSVAAGSFDEITELERMLTASGIASRRLATSHAFHSALMDPVLDPLLERLRRMPLRVPQIPYVSGVTGDWITADEATSPDYWARHCRATIRFERGIRTLVAGDVSVLLEAGPGTTLKTFARQSVDTDATILITGSIREASLERSDHAVLLESLGHLWCNGITPDWNAVHAPGKPRRVSLPTYPFERRRHWIDIAPPALASTQPAHTLRLDQTPLPNILPADAVVAPHLARVEPELIALLEELSGETIAPADRDTTFLELGFDSLFLGRFVQKLTSAFGIAITFRALMTDLPTVATLSAHIDALRPAVEVRESPAAQPDDVPEAAAVALPSAQTTAARSSTIESIVRDQLAMLQQVMREQLAAAQGASVTVVRAPDPAPTAAIPTASTPVASEAPSRFEVFRPGNSAARSEFTAAQRDHIADLVRRTVERTPNSKAFTARHRGVLADPRVAAGFRSEWKEMVYPIACDRAKGSRVWDIDGNEYIDILNGFGQTAFGHSPDFVIEAVSKQLGDGFAIGPQTPLAGEVAQLFCELTGNERVTFCNTGSEAVMAALRIARTVTGRNRVVMFSGAYHGQFDEVLVKAARTSPRALPVAPGIPSESVANMVVLPYADRASLEWVREHAGELAAVIVEPVQSRHPDLRPQEFLTEIRAITHASGTAFVIDEVVTGFRIHPGGMQAVFGLRADLATYGKVAGGGMPIGILAGTKRFMDALDGGTWEYGDDSAPEVPPTFFAGTFVRHPLTMAAVLAVLRHLKREGPALQANLSNRTAELVARLNGDFARRGIVTRIETYGSIFYFNASAEERLAALLYYHLRLRGIYIQEGFPCFLTTAHTQADIDAIVSAFSGSLDELQAAGMFRTALPLQLSRNIPLTEPQTEIWLAAQLSDEASCAFNESVTLRLAGTLDEPAFAAAWNAIVTRHDALRTVFAPTGESLQIAPHRTLDYERSELIGEQTANAAAKLEALIAHDAATPFDLIAGPLVRGHLIRVDPAQHAFILTAHHLICDGWSINVMLEEFAALYAAELAKTIPALPTPLAFSAYARSQSQRDAGQLAAVEAFWLDAFRDPPASLELPADRPRPAIRSFRGATRSRQIDATHLRAIKNAGARHGSTLFVTLLAAFGSLIGRLAQTRDIVVGVPSAGQARLEGQTLVGHCVDFLPIRARWSEHDTYADLLNAMKTQVLAAYEHQEFTLGTLVRKLALARETNRVPLAEVQFNLERLAATIALPDLTVTTTPNPKAFVNFDLFLNVIESAAGLRLDCDYNTDLFDADTIDRWLQAYDDVLETIVTEPVSRVASGTPFTAQSDSTQVEHALETAGEYTNDATLVSLIAEHVARRPDAIAATCGEERLTYAQLDMRAKRLARYLNDRFGVSGGTIGVCLPRSLDMLVALFATLRAGFAYVPLDPTHPRARLRLILDDAGAMALIGDAADVAPAGTPLIRVTAGNDCVIDDADERVRTEPHPTMLAYVIYTSGSTGRPKGVEITHRSVLNFLTSMAQTPGFTAADTLLAVTTISFDIAGLELYLPLITGGTVAIADDTETRDGSRLYQRLLHCGATVMQATPATWRMLLETDFMPGPGLKMLCGGEALRRDLADRLLANGAELWNMYGPTETTIWSSCGRVAASGPITVGLPIANTTFAILDEADRPVPMGSPGQLHIGGAGLARGYVNNAILTGEKFINNAFGTGRLYRTGDTARQIASGQFEILGRIDQQVKLRGYRIELGEIEATLSAHGALAAIAVTLQQKEQRLVAYYVARSGQPVSETSLLALAKQHLPDYMIPAVWIELDTLPLNPNGKVDRAALPAPAVETGLAFIAPRTPMETALAEIWADVLARERISVDDDIFMLGADSIQIFQITARANRRGVPLLAKQLMKARTIAALATSLADTDVATPAPRVPVRVVRPTAKPSDERSYVPLA